MVRCLLEVIFNLVINPTDKGLTIHRATEYFGWQVFWYANNNIGGY